MNFITVSGIDKSGKTSIIDAYMTKTKYCDYLVDRDPSNYMALNDIQDRLEDIEQMDNYHGFMNEFKHGITLAVLLTCQPQALQKRFRMHKELPLVGDLSFEEHQAVIEGYFDRANYPRFIKIDTTGKTVDQCVNLIINSIGE